ncbi:MAG: type I methionyl aminopeptidase [Actinoallomurus sp.]
MWKKRKPVIQIKSRDQLAVMREAGLVVGRTLQRLTEEVRPGVTTAELDVIAEESIRSAGATPSFKGYHGFPASICTSVNEEIVHGIPSPDKVLREGDIISIDCGAIVDGWHGDSAVTVPVGEITPDLQRLIEVCEESMWLGIGTGQVESHLSDIGNAIETYVRGRGDYGIVEEYVGHGIGTQMHMDPPVPNYGEAGHGPSLVPGMCFAVEPMINLGTAETVLLDDEWTVITDDGRPSAHFEHTFAVTEDGPWVLTALDGGAARGFQSRDERIKDGAQS